MMLHEQGIIDECEKSENVGRINAPVKITLALGNLNIHTLK